MEYESILEYIIRKPKKIKDYANLSKNPNVTLDMLIEYPDIDWNLRDILSYIKLTSRTLNLLIKYVNDLTPEQIVKYCGEVVDERHIWSRVSLNKTLPMYFVDNNSNLPWEWNFLSWNKSLTIKTIAKYADKNWDWYRLSYNLNITLSDIDNNINLPWDWVSISLRKDLTIEFITKHINKNWSWHDVAINGLVTMDMIENNHKIPFLCHIPPLKKFVSISKNPNLTLKFIDNYIDLPWDYEALAHNTSILKNLDKTIVKKYIDVKWFWDLISRNDFYDMDIIMDNSGKKWQWYKICKNATITQNLMSNYTFIVLCSMDGLSQNKTITMSMIDNDPYIPWDFGTLSLNPNLTMDMIKKYPTKPWCWSHLSTHPNLTMDIVEQFINKPWYWKALSHHHNLTFDIVMANTKHKWDWQALSAHHNLTFDVVMANPKRNWDWVALSKHPNLTLNIIIDNPYRAWNYEAMLLNPNIFGNLNDINDIMLYIEI